MTIPAPVAILIVLAAFSAVGWLEQIA